MADLDDGEWELSYEGCELVFGSVASGRYFLTAPDLGTADIEAGDQPRPGEDGTAFGVDTMQGPTFTFEVGLDRCDEPDPWRAVLDMLAATRGGWDAAAVRRQPAAVAVLRVRSAGQVRRVYGRPRKCEPASMRFERRGYIPVVAEFAAQDKWWYADEPTRVAVGIVPPPAGGLTAPLSSPLIASGAASAASRMLEVAGDQPAWLRATIHGPITDPTLDIGEVVTVTLRRVIAGGESVTIDARPWIREIVTSTGAGANGSLTAASTKLPDMTVAPGFWEVALRGVDPTGTATATVEVEPVHHGP